MKVILDTNVFISGIFFSGPPLTILKKWAEGHFKLVLSQQILDEYQRVAQGFSRKFPSVDITSIIDTMTIHSQLVDTLGFNVSICEDPDDNKFLECAIASTCKLIVSGDKHLLNLDGYKSINVVKPRIFVDRFL